MTLPCGVVYYFKRIRYKCRNPPGSFNTQIKKSKQLQVLKPAGKLINKIFSNNFYRDNIRNEKIVQIFENK